MPPRSRAVLAYEEAAPAPGGSRAAPAPRLAFDAVARLPEPHDNCAIARQDLPRGAALTQLPSGGSELTLSVAVLEGHRFALVPLLLPYFEIGIECHLVSIQLASADIIRRWLRTKLRWQRWKWRSGAGVHRVPGGGRGARN